MGQPAARLGDPTNHGTPLAPGPGSADVLIGGRPAWWAQRDLHQCPLFQGAQPTSAGTWPWAAPRSGSTALRRSGKET